MPLLSCYRGGLLFLVRNAAASAMMDIGQQIDPKAVSEHKDFVERLKTVAETYPELYPGKTLLKRTEFGLKKSEQPLFVLSFTFGTIGKPVRGT